MSKEGMGGEMTHMAGHGGGAGGPHGARATPTLSPRSGSEVRVLLFNATGDRDTAALLKLLLVRFCGGGGVSVGPDAWVLCLCWDLLCCECMEPRGGADAVCCLSVCPPCCPWLYPASVPPTQGSCSPGYRGELRCGTGPGRNPMGGS